MVNIGEIIPATHQHVGIVTYHVGMLRIAFSSNHQLPLPCKLNDTEHILKFMFSKLVSECEYRF